MTRERQEAELDKIVDRTGEWDNRTYTEKDYEEMEQFMKEFDKENERKKEADQKRARENVENFLREAKNAGWTIKNILIYLIDSNWKYEDIYVPISIMGFNTEKFNLELIGEDLIKYVSTIAEEDLPK